MRSPGRKCRKWAISKYSRNSPKASLHWEIFDLIIVREIGWPVSVAEGEELGSNLLHVAQSSPGDPGGSGSLKLGRRSEIPGQTGRWLYVTAPQPAARPAG
jgi:hypothetical protein